MQAYHAQFAKIYNLRWGEFAERAAPLIEDFYQDTAIGQKNRSMLDVCCGTGQLAVKFLKWGYRVVGIDLSESMLEYARQNASQFVDSGIASFIQADAGNFVLDERFGLVVSTYDSLNHLEDQTALDKCFRCVYAVLEPDGYFIFDLNTRAGLKQWNNISIDDGEELLIITRGVYDGISDKAWTKISGFLRTTDDLYQRFDLTAFNSVFDLQAVKQSLLEIGWREVHFTRVQDLRTPTADPEEEGRVFVVAHK